MSLCQQPRGDRSTANLQAVLQAMLRHFICTTRLYAGRLGRCRSATHLPRPAHAPDTAQATDDVINHIIDAAQQHAAQCGLYSCRLFTLKAPLTLMSRYAV